MCKVLKDRDRNYNPTSKATCMPLALRYSIFVPFHSDATLNQDQIFFLCKSAHTEENMLSIESRRKVHPMACHV